MGGRGASSSIGGTITIGGKTFKANAETIRFFDERKEKKLYLMDTKAEILGEKRDVYKKYQKGVANKDNYFVGTIAEFENISKRPKGQPDYVSRTREGKVSSEYWYTKDGVIRGSNHWGKDIASCDWYLKGQGTNMKGNKQYGKVKWSDFVQKTEVMTNNGKAVLTNFDNTIGGRRQGGGSVLPIVKGIND